MGTSLFSFDRFAKLLNRSNNLKIPIKQAKGVRAKQEKSVVEERGNLKSKTKQRGAKKTTPNRYFRGGYDYFIFFKIPLFRV